MKTYMSKLTAKKIKKCRDIIDNIRSLKIG